MLNAFGSLIMGLIALIAIVANLILLYILFVRIKVKLYSNMLFSSLALSDLLIGLCVIPFEIIVTLTVKSFNNIAWLRSFLIWSGYSQTSVSLFVLVFLTLHRLHLIIRPLKTSERLSRPRLAILVGIWLSVYLFVGVCCLIDAFA